ncbi:hypothetical protein ACFPVT_07215 [Corynebacterium choanae]|uniref:AsnC family protein n=1 Tax=Corynebacterium choanae TaxID=1862358 RepID=A0A3G6J7Y1_9CORY|nr:hypothetical protein [Corynebacterium choanae]AZA13883.1 hypothetical protein CCHOA_07455 [Corynebacterium choanae]
MPSRQISGRLQQRLFAVQQAAVAEVEAKQRVHDTVVEAHAAGADWAQIAHFLGVTEAAARRRFHQQPVPTEQPTLF